VRIPPLESRTIETSATGQRVSDDSVTLSPPRQTVAGPDSIRAENRTFAMIVGRMVPKPRWHAACHLS
jgi:hypothetical protein